MQKTAIIFLLFFIFFPMICIAQFGKQLDSLCIMCNRSTSDSEKVATLDKLAGYYYVYKMNEQGDSVLHQQLLVAQLSNNSNLILQALFGNAILNMGTTETSESFDKTIQFIQQGIDYAKSIGQYDYIALGYARMSDILIKRGKYDKALSNSVIALSSLQNVTSDSVKAVIYIAMGNAYLSLGEAVAACSNYNNAFDIAIKIKSVPLQSIIHHCISEMYRKLDDRDNAKNELNQSLELNKKYSNENGLINDYYDLARLTDEKYFIDKTIELADSLHDYKNLLYGKNLMLVYYYVVEKDDQKALHYLEYEPDLKQSFLNSGIENYFLNVGNIYFYSGHTDSALRYYKIIEPQINKKFDRNLSRFILEQLAECYSLKNNFPEAISYYLKALEISEQMDDATTIELYSDKLSGLYEKQNDYKNAFIYSKQSVVYKDSLREFSKENDIALLGVERENRKHQQEMLQEQQQNDASRNIQYMAITIAIVIIFFVMLFVGSFPVSKLTVKLMGYFFFISLFEFIVLLIDNVVLTHSIHNQPLKLWLIKIGVIAILVPFQHFLEHHVIRLLASRKLIEARTKFSVRKWWAKINKPSLGEEAMEEDASVL